MTTATEVDEDEPHKAERYRSAFADRGWWLRLLKTAFGKSFWGFLAFAIAAGSACWLVLGETAFFDALETDAELILKMMPRVALALTVAGLIALALGTFVTFAQPAAG